MNYRIRRRLPSPGARPWRIFRPITQLFDWNSDVSMRSILEEISLRFSELIAAGFSGRASSVLANPCIELTELHSWTSGVALKNI